MIPSCALWLALSLPACGDEPKPKIRLGKETTYFEGPLDKDGYVDFEAALNDRLAKGITPETNANVLLWKALGPSPSSQPIPEEYFKRLGMPKPPAAGPYFKSAYEVLKEKLAEIPEGLHSETLDRKALAGKRPWQAGDHPWIAAWIGANEIPLAVVAEAVRRPKYYNPILADRHRRGRELLIASKLRNVQELRDVASALAARAMLRLGEGKFEEAWRDLLTCRQLGWQLANGATPLEGLVGIAVDYIACTAQIAFIERVPMSALEFRDRLRNLQKQPPFPAFADKVDLAERAAFLDALQMVRRGREEIGTSYIECGRYDPQVLDAIDWELAFKNGNVWYDRAARAIKIEAYAERRSELEKFEASIAAFRKEPYDWDYVFLLAQASFSGEKALAKAVGERVGNTVVSRMMPGVVKVQTAWTANVQLQRNVILALALEAYRGDAGLYPDKLSSLLPKYLEEIPDDVFSQKPLIYTPAGKAYLLYSVGPNGSDDGGRTREDDPPGDDIAIRMPLPALK